MARQTKQQKTQPTTNPSQRRSRPRPKAKAQSGPPASREQGTSLFAPKGKGYYDAFANPPETGITPVSVGPVTPVEGYARYTIMGRSPMPSGYSGPPLDNSTLLVLNTDGKGWVGRSFHIGVNSSAPTTLLIETTEFIAGALYDILYGDPEPITEVNTSVPIRFSVRFVNTSEALVRGGLVRCLRYHGVIDVSEISTVQKYSDMCEMVRNSPRAKTFSGETLTRPVQVNSYPSSLVDMSQFARPSFADTTKKPGLCNILLLIDRFNASSSLHNNTYEIEVKAQRGARFAPGTLLHSMARTLKSGSHDQHIQHEERQMINA